MRTVREGFRPDGLFAPRLDGWNFREIGWQFVRLEHRNLQRNEAEHRHAKFRRAVRTVHHHRHAGDRAAVGANNVNRLLHATALGHDILDNENFFSGCNLEPAPQDEFAVLFFHEDETDAELPRHFLADYESAHRWRNDRDRAERFDLRRQRRAELLDDRHLLEREGALEKLPAVQTAAEDEMAFEQRSAIAENFQNVVLRHRRKL